MKHSAGREVEPVQRVGREGLTAGEKVYKESKWEEDEEKGVRSHPGEEPKLLQTTGTASSF